MPRLRVSALTGEGIPALRPRFCARQEESQRVATKLASLPTRGIGLVATHWLGLMPRRMRSADKVPHEMVLLDLYSALRPLDGITGATTNDDILNLIFSRFCIGK